MKTWEMVKELTENKNKTFNSKDYRGYKVEVSFAISYEYENIEYNGVILAKYFSSGDEEPLIINDFWIKSEWEEVKEPVTFVEACQDILKYNNRKYVSKFKILSYSRDSKELLLSKIGNKTWNGICGIYMEKDWYLYE